MIRRLPLTAVLAIQIALGCAFGQQTELRPLETAEERVERLRLSGDIEGLAEYALKLVKNARDKSIFIDQQAKLISDHEAALADLKAKLTQMEADATKQQARIDQLLTDAHNGLLKVQVDLDSERQKQQKMLEMLSGMNGFGPKEQAESITTGAVLGTAIGKKTGWAAAGGLANFALQKWLHRKK